VVSIAACSAAVYTNCFSTREGEETGWRVIPLGRGLKRGCGGRWVPSDLAKINASCNGLIFYKHWLPGIGFGVGGPVAAAP
jgi:hypothetical protein